MSLSKIYLNSFYYGVIPKISTIINVLLLPLLTPYLTAYDYGIWGIVSSYSAIFLAVAPLGLNIHLTNSYFEYKNKWNIVWGHILFLFFISGLCLSLIYIGVILIELDQINFDKRLIIAICSALPILFFGNGTLASHLYPLLGKPKPLVFRNLVASLSAIIVFFVAVYIFHLGYWGFILNMTVGALVTFFLFLKPLYKQEQVRPTIERSILRMKKWLTVAWPVIPHSLGFILLSSSSRIVMSNYNISLEEIGLFSNGFIMGDYITVVTTALATALVPQIQAAYRNNDFVKYRKLYYLCQITTLCAIFCISFWMPEIYKILIRNESLQECNVIASYICFANALLPLYTFTSTIAFIEKKTKQLLWLIFIPGIINIILCLIFIPIYGYQAAIYTTLLSYWSQILIPFISSYHKNKILLWLGNRYKLFWVLAGLLGCLCLSLIVVNFPIYLKIILTFLTIGLYLGTLKLKKYDVII